MGAVYIYGREKGRTKRRGGLAMKLTKDKYKLAKAKTSAVLLIITGLLIYYIHEGRVVMISLIAALMILLILKVWYDFVDVCKERDILRKRAHASWGVPTDELNSISEECNNT